VVAALHKRRLKGISPNALILMLLPEINEFPAVALMTEKVCLISFSYTADTSN
jgi:hypothetical protein